MREQCIKSLFTLMPDIVNFTIRLDRYEIEYVRVRVRMRILHFL